MRRVAFSAMGVAAWWLLSCREIPAPEEGVESISRLILPSPGLVVNDTMRDSLGLVAPLQVIAFDAEGNEVPGVTATFIVRDTNSHVDGALLIGDDTLVTKVLASIAGLQTPSVDVPVTLPPQALVARDSVRHRIAPAFTDSVALSGDLRTQVLNNQGAPKGIQAIIVRYEIVQSPAPTPSPSGPTAVMVTESNALSTRDTTDAQGIAARRLRFRFSDIAATTTDSAIINATASYRGLSLGTVQFTVVFTKQ